MLQDHSAKFLTIDPFHHLAARFTCAFALAACFAFSGAPAHAGDDLVIVPHGSVVHIANTELLANDPAGSSVSAVTQTARGVLTVLPAGLDYAPSQSFATFGMDSFTYQADGTIQRVLLVAGLDATLEATGPGTLDGGSCVLAAGWSINTYNGTRQSPTFVSGGGSECGAVYDPAAPLLLARLGAPGGGDPTTPGGGHTSMILDPGDDPNGGGVNTGGGDIEWALAVDDLGSPVLRLLETSAGELVAEVLSNGVPLGTTAPVAMPPGPDPFGIGLTWWFEADAASRDGGLLLEVDGRFETALVGLPFPAQDLHWGFGPDDTRQPDTPATLWSAEVFVSAAGARYPIFSDHGHGPVAAWSGTVQGGSIQTVQQPNGPARRLDVPLSASPVQLVDVRPDGPKSYRASFELDPASLALSDYHQATLFEASYADPGGQGTVEPFGVQLRWHPLYGFQIRGQALHNTFRKSTPWVGIGTGTASSTVELSWRASSDGPSRDGVFSLWVDGGTAATIPGLHNAFMRVDEVRFGLADLPINASGSLIVDSYDAWR